jgi:tRNA 2-thiouridine synthesizing protein A
MPHDDAHGRIVVDTRGTFCPVPIIKTSAAIRNLHPGGVVEVISDDPAIEHDMPAWCKSTSHTILSVHREGNDIHYVIEKA